MERFVTTKGTLYEHNLDSDKWIKNTNNLKEYLVGGAYVSPNTFADLFHSFETVMDNHIFNEEDMNKFLMYAKKREITEPYGRIVYFRPNPEGFKLRVSDLIEIIGSLDLDQNA
jgi:hypothetical protein